MMPSPAVIGLIGNTPLLKLDRLSYWLGDKRQQVQILAKAEFCNPGGSVKDRAAWNMIKEGIQSGELTPEKVILDSSSGNTGVAYAMIGAAIGYAVGIGDPGKCGLQTTNRGNLRGARDHDGCSGRIRWGDGNRT